MDFFYHSLLYAMLSILYVAYLNVENEINKKKEWESELGKSGDTHCACGERN